MPEVHRYKVVTMLSAAGATIGYDQHGRDVVMAHDLDRVTGERDALQQRLTAADERADVLEGLLREVQKSARKQDWARGYPTLFASVDAVLKPACPAKCERCGCSTVETCDERGCGFLGAGNGAPE